MGVPIREVIPNQILKVDIYKDLPDQSEHSWRIMENDIRAANKAWCQGSRYWDCLIEDSVRINLNGNATRCVTIKEAELASKLKIRQPIKKTPKNVSSLPKPC